MKTQLIAFWWRHKRRTSRGRRLLLKLRLLGAAGGVEALHNVNEVRKEGSVTAAQNKVDELRLNMKER